MDFATIISIAAMGLALGAIFIRPDNHCDEVADKLNELTEYVNGQSKRHLMLEEALGYELQTGDRLVHKVK